MLLKIRLASPLLATAVLILSAAPGSLPAGQQSQPYVGSIDPSQFANARSLGDTLNEEAEASDSAGIHRYSEHLIRLLVPDRAGQKYIRSLTDQLARAEGLARAGKSDLVPEAKVAQAYNDLMKEVGAPTSLFTNEVAVRNHRLIPFDKPSDALITMSRNGANCNPGEAVFLLLALFWNNGGPRVRLENAPGAAQPSGIASGRGVAFTVISPTDPSAGRYLEIYSAAHPPRDTAALFNAVTGSFHLNSQPIIQEGFPTMQHSVPLFDALSKEIEVADTPKGAEVYSRHLIKLFVGNEMGDDFVSVQASHLATVDILARREERGYVGESSVADAFNELMKKLQGRDSRAITTDAATVHRLRLGISHASPALTTVSVHASSCLPSEALLLIVLLITNNGAIGEPSSPGSAPRLRGTTGHRLSSNAEASLVLADFLSSHSQSEDVRLFDVLKKYLGF